MVNHLRSDYEHGLTTYFEPENIWVSTWAFASNGGVHPSGII